jgi:hypothetical protein
MKLYFSKVTTDHWVAKNKLEAAAKDLAHELDRQLIPEDKIPTFRAMIRQRLVKLNEEYSRCKPLVIDIYSPEDEARYLDFAVDVPYVFRMSLFAVNGDSIYELNFFEYKKISQL